MFLWVLVSLYSSQCMWVVSCLHWATTSFVFSELFVIITQWWIIYICCSVRICRIYLNACVRNLLILINQQIIVYYCVTRKNLILLKINRSQFIIVWLERVWVCYHVSSSQFNMMWLHWLRAESFFLRFSVSCSWHSKKNEQDSSFYVIVVICSNIMCWVT